MNVPDGLFCTKEHEWVKIDGNEGTVGITDYAQGSLGDITFVELPAVGFEVEQFGVLGEIESIKAASEIYAPLSGKVTAVNESLRDAPEAVNQSPYDEGWIAVIEVRDMSETNQLMNSQDYRVYLEGLA